MTTNFVKPAKFWPHEISPNAKFLGMLLKHSLKYVTAGAKKDIDYLLFKKYYGSVHK